MNRLKAHVLRGRKIDSLMLKHLHKNCPIFFFFLKSLMRVYASSTAAFGAGKLLTKVLPATIVMLL